MVSITNFQILLNRTSLQEQFMKRLMYGKISKKYTHIGNRILKLEFSRKIIFEVKTGQPLSKEEGILPPDCH